MNNDILICEGFWNQLTNRITSTLRVVFTDSSTDIKKCNVIWDTGSTHSIVLKKTIEKYNLIPFKKIGILSRPENGKKYRVFKADIYLSEKEELFLKDFQITEYNLNWDADIIIGMDIIRLGTFFIKNDNNKTRFTFLLSNEWFKKIKEGWSYTQ